MSPAASADGSTDLILDVDLEGRRMHVTCFGPMVPGEPIVLFEAGGGSPSDTWDAVVDALVPTQRACSYDRAGVGASEPAPEARTHHEGPGRGSREDSSSRPGSRGRSCSWVTRWPCGPWLCTPPSTRRRSQASCSWIRVLPT